ncbi:MAG: hypothetical protein IPL95_04120 [Saprospiraceae bacterium]|nr:hypothetical protein [Saprospiraceae bacterium]
MKHITYTINLILLFAIILANDSCYTLKGFSISPDTNTYYVKTFDNTTPNAPPTIGQQLTEDFKTKVRNQTRLTYNDLDPNIEFIGTITDYIVSSEAPQANATTAFNRLEIGIQIEYINHKDEKKNWKQKFSRFSSFPAETNLLDVQNQLITDISKLLFDDIFRKSFEDW